MCFLDFEYIYICLFLSHLLVNTFWLPFYFLHPQAPDHIYNEILNLKQKWEKCTARKATPDKVIFCLGFSCNFTYICLTDHANANAAR